MRPPTPEPTATESSRLDDLLELANARGANGDGGSLLAGTTAGAFFATARALGCPEDLVRNLMRMGVVLQPKQLSASALARSCDLDLGPVELAYGGARGGGKSFWLLAQLADDCLRYPGLKCLLLRKVGTSGKEGFEDLLPRVLGGIRYRYVPSDNVLIFPNGSRIKLGHFKDEKDVDKYLGLEYDVIGVEEATTLSASKYKAIRTCNRTSKPGWRPRIYSTTNPGGVGHDWYRKRFINPWRDHAETTTRFIPATIDDNVVVNVGYRGVLDSLTGWQLRAWRYGDWDIASGQYFTTFNREFHVCPAIGAVPQHWTSWLAMDYGFRHYTVALLMTRSSEGVVYIVDEHAERRWLPAQHTAAIDAMLGRHGLRRQMLEACVIGGDMRTTESDGRTRMDRYADLGWHFEVANMSRIDGAFEIMHRLGDPAAGRVGTMLIAASCAGLIDRIPAMVHSDIRPEDVKKVDCDEEGLGGDDHVDSLRYGLMHVAEGPALLMASSPTADYRG
jgi:phage terminase large subunit